MYEIIKKAASRLSTRHLQTLKRIHLRRQIRKGRFISNEPEFAHRNDWLVAGDWALDIGANVGHYTLRLAELVGANGRVIALEPMPQAFELLTTVATRYRNVTLLNVAASEGGKLVGMKAPAFSTGLINFYQAGIVTASCAPTSVLTLPIDSLHLPHPVRFVKIDTEGHELAVLRGMRKLILRDKPLMVVEGRSADVQTFLMEIGYRFKDFNESPNRVFFVPG